MSPVCTNWVLMALWWLVLSTTAWAQSPNCAVCGEAIKDVVVFTGDKVTGQKQSVCLACSRLPRECYLCGMPVKKDFTELSDQRALCARDVKTVVLDEAEALHIAKETRNELDRLFSRFASFTENVTLRMADRVDILNLFHVPGNDFDCPNVLGYTQRATNNATNISYTISLLSALPPRQLRATAAHEWAHTWIMENVSSTRQAGIERDAREGFCELVSYLLMESQKDQVELGVIRSNAYTRGQILLFIEAERRFGFNDVLDWMKSGVDARLHAEALERIRAVETPTPTNPPPVIASAPAPRTAFTEVVLQGITWSKTQPTVLINGRTLAPGAEARVPLHGSNVLVRCLSIQPGAAAVQIGGETERRWLKLPPKRD